MPAKEDAKQQPVESLTHKVAKRRNAPTEQTAPMMDEDDLAPSLMIPEPIAKSASQLPRLSWMRAEGLEGMNLDATPLFIHEKILPAVFVDSLKAGGGDTQCDMFDSFNGLPENAAYEWYKHEGNWSNRIIRGPSLEVMASLVAKDGLAGKVQCVYFDPPYGINFRSHFQPDAKAKASGGAKQAKKLPGDPGPSTVFCDNYVNGIHSYLDGVYRTAKMVRTMLADSGSLFLQISRPNLFRVALVLDEVFGANNQVTIIPFKKSGGTSSDMLPEGTDYILWYAKDKTAAKTKWRQIYEPLKTLRDKANHMRSYAMLELADGTERNLTKAEKGDLDANMPEGARLFRRMRLGSQGHSDKGRSEPYLWRDAPPDILERLELNGGEPLFSCKAGEHWRVSMEGLDRLAELGRLSATSLEGLSWKRYADEVPGRQMHNLWAEQSSATDMHYTVETAEKVIERCILMTTDPGDLVLDPTCGSGTTAFVAEKWGRRWITIDAGTVAVSLTRQRITTGVFEAHLLKDSPEGALKEELLAAKFARREPRAIPRDEGAYRRDPAKGFVCKRVPTVSAAVLAYDSDEPPTLLVNQTLKREGYKRVASPFTVESHSPYRVLAPHLAAQALSPAAANVQKNIEESLAKWGVRVKEKCMRVRDIKTYTPIGKQSSAITHLARTDMGATAVCIAPDDVSVCSWFIRSAQADAVNLNMKALLIIAFHFTADTATQKVGRLTIVKARANQDLRIGGLKKGAEDRGLVCVGEPDVEIRPASGQDDHWVAEVKGYDIYDPSTRNNRTATGNADDIVCWMLDTEHDGQSFFARRIHFPGDGSDGQIRRFKRELAKRIDAIRWKAALSLTSHPFPAPKSGKVAVRIVTRTHDEMTQVIDVK